MATDDLLRSLVSPDPLVMPGPGWTGISVNWRAWADLGAKRWITGLVRHGYAISFASSPPLAATPFYQLPSSNPAKAAAMDSEIGILLAKNAIEHVSPSQIRERGFYSNMFLVQKSSGAWRPIINLKALNAHIHAPHFTMDSIEKIRPILGPHEWAISIDLKDAYFHIEMAPQSRKYLRFTHKGEVYQFRVLAFGLSTAPYIFTALMDTVLIHLKRQGINIHMYLDDWLIRNVDLRLLKLHSELILKLCSSLGLCVNMEKSDLTPSRDFVFLGCRIRTSVGLIMPTEKRIAKIQRLGLTLMKNGGGSARNWQKVLGLLASTEKTVRLGRMHMRPVQLNLKSLWRSTWSGQHWVPLREDARLALTWWLDSRKLSPGVPLVPPSPSVMIFTDSSTEGWGGHWNQREISGLWSTQDRDLHINLLELRAAFLVCNEWEELLRNQSVLIMSDNSTVVAYINHQGGTKSRSLSLESQAFLQWAESTGILHLSAAHIRGELNVRADALSRRSRVLKGEWMLSAGMFRSILKRTLFAPTIDLFATHLNSRLPRFFSPLPHPRAEAVDGLAQDWTGLTGYAFPPGQLLPRVIRKIAAEDCIILLVASANPRLAILGQMMDLSVAPPLDLREDGKISQTLPDGQEIWADISVYRHLHVWTLSRQRARQRAYRQTLLGESSTPSLPRLGRSTTGSGGCSLIGVSQGLLILSQRVLQTS